MLSRLSGDPLIGFAGLAALAWATVGAITLLGAPRRTTRRLPRLLAPTLLGAVAIVPTAIGLLGGSDVRTVAPHSTAVANRILNVALVAVVLLLFLRAANGRIQPRLRHPLLFGSLLAYWLVGFASEVANGRQPVVLSFYVVPIVIIAAATLFPSASDTRGSLLVVGTLVCLVSLAYAVVNRSQSHFLPARMLSGIESERLSGITVHPNSLGMIAGVTLIISFCDRNVPWRFVLLGLSLTTLLLTESRAAWVGVGAAAVLVLFGRSRLAANRGHAPAIWPPLLGAFAIGLLGVCGLFLTGSSPSVASLDGRAPIWTYVANNWSHSPVVGAGPGVWRVLIDRGVIPSVAGQAHNQLLETLFTLGIVGVFLLGLITVAWVRAAAYAAATGEWVSLALLVFLGAVSVVEAPLRLGEMDFQVWLILALAAGTSIGERSPAGETSLSRLALAPVYGK